MRAWQVQQGGSPREAMVMVELDEPRPGPGEVRLRVGAAAVGMPDVFMCHTTYPLTPSLPFVAGQEVCGVVEEVGEGVDLELGTRLMAVTNFYDGRGGFAEATIARADSAYRVPDSMSDVDAASFRIGFSTGWIGLVRRGGLVAGETLLVLGAAGGSGATAVQLGKALGARVLAVASGDEKLDFCRRMGAEVVIDRRADDVREAIMAATGGRGVDAVYDPVGGELAGTAVRCLAPGGRLLAVGFASGEWVSVDAHLLVRGNWSVVGVFAGGFTRAEGEADHEALLSLASEGKLDGFATIVDFDDLPDALERVAAADVIGKMVAVVGPLTVS